MAQPSPLGMGLGLRPVYYPDILEKLRGWTGLKSFRRISWFRVVAPSRCSSASGPPIRSSCTASLCRSHRPRRSISLILVRSKVSPIGSSLNGFRIICAGPGCMASIFTISCPFLILGGARPCRRRIMRVQDFLGRRIAIENVSSYITFAESEMDEWTFVREVAERADCWLLLDVNNVFVSSFNHGFDPARYIEAIPKDRVVQFHLAGHSEAGTHKIDTHDQPSLRRSLVALF